MNFVVALYSCEWRSYTALMVAGSLSIRNATLSTIDQCPLSGNPCLVRRTMDFRGSTPATDVHVLKVADGAWKGSSNTEVLR
jgi:hypothetical protein